MRDHKAQKTLNIRKTTNQQKCYGYFATALGAFFLAYILASIFAPVKNSSAEEQEVATVVANATSGVSVTAGQDTITLDVGQPESVGTIVKASDTLTADTASESGYQLYISMDNNHAGGNRLYLGGDKEEAYIAPNHDSSGDDITFGQEAALSSNSWGFTIDGAKYNDSQFAAVPLMGNEALIDETDSAGSNDVDVYYGVKVNTNMGSGTYSGRVIYTIIAEDAQADNYSTPSINRNTGLAGTQAVITLPLRSDIDTVSELGTITAKIGGVACNNQSVSLGTASLSINCTVPQPATGRGAKDVSVSIQQYGDTYTNSGAFTYLTYMHEMTGDICSNMADNSTDTLKDIRGSYTDATTPAEYGIIKALDGNCWMRDNLNLYGMTISANYSDFKNGTYELPTASSSSGAYNVPKTFRATASGYTDQVYYNWTAAVALQEGSVIVEQSQSVCPKNWQLPVNGDVNTDKSYAKLMSAYNVANGSQLTNKNYAGYILGFTRYYGFWWAGSEGYHGAQSVFWSSTPSSSSHAYTLIVDDNTCSPQTSYAKGEGFNIRCVSRD